MPVSAPAAVNPLQGRREGRIVRQVRQPGEDAARGNGVVTQDGHKVEAVKLGEVGDDGVSVFVDQLPERKASPICVSSAYIWRM